METTTTPTKRINEKQKEYLVEFMDKNYTFLFGKFSSSCGKTAKDEKWLFLCDELNKLGPPLKETALWKKVRIKNKYSISSAL